MYKHLVTLLSSSAFKAPLTVKLITSPWETVVNKGTPNDKREEIRKHHFILKNNVHMHVYQYSTP